MPKPLNNTNKKPTAFHQHAERKYALLKDKCPTHPKELEMLSIIGELVRSGIGAMEGNSGNFRSQITPKIQLATESPPTI